jgi:hypothetical protein
MDSSLGANVAPSIGNPAELVVPTITLYEVYKKLRAEKDEEYALDVVSYMQTGTVIGLAAANISRTHKLPMADSIIYATSLRYSAVIVPPWASTIALVMAGPMPMPPERWLRGLSTR